MTTRGSIETTNPAPQVPATARPGEQPNTSTPADAGFCRPVSDAPKPGDIVQAADCYYRCWRCQKLDPQNCDRSDCPDIGEGLAHLFGEDEAE